MRARVLYQYAYAYMYVCVCLSVCFCRYARLYLYLSMEMCVIRRAGKNLLCAQSERANKQTTDTANTQHSIHYTHEITLHLCDYNVICSN